MSQFEELLGDYKEDMSKLGISYNAALLEKVAKGLGPSIYNSDSSKVSCSDDDEMETVKNNFLIKKLGLSDSPQLDAGLKAVCEQMGTSNRNKSRVIFYYLLVEKFGKQNVYN